MIFQLGFRFSGTNRWTSYPHIQPGRFSVRFPRESQSSPGRSRASPQPLPEGFCLPRHTAPRRLRFRSVTINELCQFGIYWNSEIGQPAAVTDLSGPSTEPAERHRKQFSAFSTLKAKMRPNQSPKAGLTGLFHRDIKRFAVSAYPFSTPFCPPCGFGAQVASQSSVRSFPAQICQESGQVVSGAWGSFHKS